MPSALGTFANLPAEIRAEIWSNFAPELRSTTTFPHLTPIPPDRPHGLEILRTSHQIHNEVSAILHNRDLCFRITSIEESPLGDCPHQHLDIKALPGACMRDLKSLPFAKFKRLRFEVNAPKRGGLRYFNPSRLMQILYMLFCICLDHHRRGRLELARVREIGIVLLEPRAVRLRPVMGFGKMRIPETGWSVEECVRVIMAFGFLRGVKRMSVELPGNVVGGGVEGAVERLEEDAKRMDEDG